MLYFPSSGRTNMKELDIRAQAPLPDGCAQKHMHAYMRTHTQELTETHHSQNSAPDANGINKSCQDWQCVLLLCNACRMVDLSGLHARVVITLELVLPWLFAAPGEVLVRARAKLYKCPLCNERHSSTTLDSNTI
jgi:hypothetical protein